MRRKKALLLIMFRRILQPVTEARYNIERNEELVTKTCVMRQCCVSFYVTPGNVVSSQEQEAKDDRILLSQFYGSKIVNAKGRSQQRQDQVPVNTTLLNKRYYKKDETSDYLFPYVASVGNCTLQ